MAERARALVDRQYQLLNQTLLPALAGEVSPGQTQQHTGGHVSSP